MVIQSELYGDNITNTSSDTPTRLPVLAEGEKNNSFEKHVHLGAVIEVSHHLFFTNLQLLHQADVTQKCVFNNLLIKATDIFSDHNVFTYRIRWTVYYQTDSTH